MLPFQSYKKANKQYSRENRQKPTLTEKIMRNALRKDQLGYRFLRQKLIGPYITDFYCAKLQLCIEVDGSSHIGREVYDARRDVYFTEHGIITLRFTNEEVLQDGERIGRVVKEWIEHKE